MHAGLRLVRKLTGRTVLPAVALAPTVLLVFWMARRGGSAVSPPVVLNHLLEAALFVMAIALVRRAWARALLAALYFVIVGAQLLTYDLSYAFLTQLALDNIDSSSVGLFWRVVMA